MENLICPYCKERYQVDKVIEYKRFICGNCGRKHIYHLGRMVPFSLLRRPNTAARIEVCAYCRNDFSLPEDASGEYICPYCNNALYILPPSGEMPGSSPEEDPHTLDAPPSAGDTHPAAIPASDLGTEADPRRFLDEPRRDIDIRKLPPPPPPRNSGLFGNQPSSGDVPGVK